EDHQLRDPPYLPDKYSRHLFRPPYMSHCMLLPIRLPSSAYKNL
ncbi:hypothetical protein, partial [Pseudomonas sp. FEN]